MTSATRTRNRRGEGALLREELVTTASRMLDELGDVDLLSLRGLAAEIGIAAPSIYRHFPDKAALLVAVVERSFRELTADMVTAWESGGDDPFEGLRRAGAAYLRFGQERPAHYRIVFGGDGLPCDTETPMFMRQSGKGAFETLVSMVEACLVAGPGGRELDAFTVAVEVWAMQHGLVDLPLANRTFPWPDLQGVTDAWLTRFRQTVMTKPTTPAKPGRARG